MIDMNVEQHIQKYNKKNRDVVPRYEVLYAIEQLKEEYENDGEDEMGAKFEALNALRNRFIQNI